MRIIDRLLQYLSLNRWSPYSFEKTCKIANGYLRKQEKGKGTIGSHILDKIHQNFPELNVNWLLTGEGNMVVAETSTNRMEEQSISYTSKEHLKYLTERIILLESAIADKEKIIDMLEQKLKP